MKICTLKEIKENENRVALTPEGVKALTNAGHEVVVEKSAGLGSNFSDEMYEDAGARIEKNPEEIVKKCRLIVKVKEPLKEEYGYFSGDNIIFTFFHFAGSKELTEAMMKSKATCVSYETVEEGKNLPLLQPMSEVAGRVGVVVGCNYLSKCKGGRGVLIGDTVEKVKVLVIGGGHVGKASALLAADMGAEVKVLEINEKIIEEINSVGKNNLKAFVSNEENIEKYAKETDLLVGAVLVPGAIAPKIVKRSVVEKMKKGSVIVDVAIDQGGCVETIKITSHSNPTFDYKGVIHYGVPNMPGAYPQTSTLKLTKATLPYVLKIAEKDLPGIKDDPGFRKGLNVINGNIVYKPVADAHNLPYTEL